MGKKLGLAVAIVLGLGAITGLAWLLRDANFAVLNPQGAIAEQQRNLLFFTLVLSSIVIIPVFALTGFIAWRFRAGNHKAKYRPDWQHSRLLETVWWGIPFAIIAVLAIVTWQTSHSLDPYKPLESKVKPLEVQVVALQWKWLFIYPDYDIASVGMLKVPAKTPLNFTITADAPMNSFWIPSLGGQVYAMSGMSTKLHLIADSTGTYTGRSANISGEGFSDMEFAVESVAEQDFEVWANVTRSSAENLDMAEYNELAKPATLDKPQVYALKKDNLYDTIVMKYMPHGGSHKQTEVAKPEMDHDDHMGHMEGME